MKTHREIFRIAAATFAAVLVGIVAASGPCWEADFAHAADPSLIFLPDGGEAVVEHDDDDEHEDDWSDEDPHAFMNADGTCLECHDTYRGDLDPHAFVVSITETCRTCHAKEKLGRSHPVNVDPRYGRADVEVPEELPLEEGLVSCGSCHNPHASYVSRTKAFDKEVASYVGIENGVEVNYYKTYYLRISDPVAGITPLCSGCHPAY